MAQDGAAAAISRGRRGGDVTPPSREPRPSLLSFLRKRSAEKMSPEEETCPKRRKTGGRRIGGDFSLWEKWQLLQTHEKELALIKQAEEPQTKLELLVAASGTTLVESPVAPMVSERRRVQPGEAFF